MTLTKICTRCGEDKPLDEFHRKPKGKLDRAPMCKPCRAEYRRELTPDCVRRAPRKKVDRTKRQMAERDEALAAQVALNHKIALRWS